MMNCHSSLLQHGFGYIKIDHFMSKMDHMIRTNSFHFACAGV
jgi:hypothetical protein